MAKMTLLEIVQDILSDMNSDEADSITDTIESLQVAQIVKSVYFEMMANKNWPHLHNLMTLNSSADLTKPTHMSVPEDLKELTSIAYNVRKLGATRDSYQEIPYIHPDEFLKKTNSFNGDNDNVQSVTDFSGVKFQIRNNRAPECWTSFDDQWVVFDGFNNEVDTTLQTSKTQCMGYRSPVFTLSDTFVPDLPEEAFPALLAEAKSTAFTRIKQMPDAKAEQQSTRQRNWLSRKAWQTAGGIRFPNYGRAAKRNRGR